MTVNLATLRGLADMLGLDIDQVVLAEAADEIEDLRTEAIEYRRSHELMSAQFKIMQREKEHGWQEAEKWQARAGKAEAELREAHAAADFWFRERIALREELDRWRNLTVTCPVTCPAHPAPVR